MRFILVLLLSCACAFGATTLTDGIVSSYYTESGGIYTYFYEVEARPYSNKKLSTFRISVSNDDVFNVQSDISSSYVFTEGYLEFFDMMITNQNRITFSLQSMSPAQIAKAAGFDSFEQRLHDTYVPIPEPNCFFLALWSVGCIVILRRRSE